MSAQVYSDGALVEEWDDTTRTYTDHTTTPPTTRPYTQAEDDAADARLSADARLDDHEARITAIEAHLWPADPDPEPGTTPDAPTWDDLDPAGWWRDGALLADGGTVWRNVSGTVLTTPPSGFPGGPERWTHLFIEVGATTDPGTGDTYPAWSPDASYEVGDRVTHDGHAWECLIAHGPEQQGTWAPGPATPTIWTDLGPTA